MGGMTFETAVPAGRKILVPWDRSDFAVATVARGELGAGRTAIRTAARDHTRAATRAAALRYMTGPWPAGSKTIPVEFEHLGEMSTRRLLAKVQAKQRRDGAVG